MYIPALVVPAPNFHWWKENSKFKYVSALVSAAYGIKKPNFRDEFGMPRKGFILFGDSGGFQNMTQNIHLNPLDVLTWQEKNCNVGFTFDLPLFANDSKKVILDKQTRTVDNAMLMLKHKENPIMDLYAVIQGHSGLDQKRIFNMYDKDIENFEGLAIGGLVPLNHHYVLETEILCRFIDNVRNRTNIKQLHFFGIGSSNNAWIIKYLIKKLKGYTITHDTSYYRFGNERKFFMTEPTLNRAIFIPSDNKLQYAPCFCPVCSKTPWKEYDTNDIMLHNLYMCIDFDKRIEVMMDDEELFKNHLKYKKSKILPAIEFIDEFMENGLDSATRKFASHKRIVLNQGKLEGF